MEAPKAASSSTFLRSRINEAVKLSERLVLPRLRDLAADLLELLEMGGGDHIDTVLLAVDFKDAFHTLP
eukprot:11781693-Heterocapsa_arctica.AAC.1